MLKTKTKRELEVELFNLQHRPGQRVRFWMGIRGVNPRIGQTSSEAMLLGGHTPVVYINGVGAIALTHVEPIE